jgi:hypothetical protein
LVTFVVQDANMYAVNKIITVDEVKAAILASKSKKAPGLDGMQAGVLKARIDDFAPALTSLFNAGFKLGFCPEFLKTTLIAPIHKKGDPSDPANFRPIALLSLFYKTYTAILYGRLQRFSDQRDLIPDEQFGFRKGLSTHHAAFVLQCAVLKQVRHLNNPLYCCFIDFSNAFPSVDHALLFAKLRRLGVSSHFTLVLESLYSNCNGLVKVGDRLSNEFPLERGVKQGDALSPLLFSLFISDLKPFLSSQCPSSGITVAGSHVLTIKYADDIALLATSAPELQRLLAALEQYSFINRLVPNPKKTKVMIFAKRQPRGAQRLAFALCGAKLEIVRSFVYLGIPFASTLNWGEALRHARIRGKAIVAQLFN